MRDAETGGDFAGVVESSSSPAWQPGDKVILNGWGVGETHLGAYAEKARVKGQWLVRLPERLTARDAMAIGTAITISALAAIAVGSRNLAARIAGADSLWSNRITVGAGIVGAVLVTVLGAAGFLAAEALDSGFSDVFRNAMFGAAVFTASQGYGGWGRSILEHGAVRYVGQISYGLYLFHNFVQLLLGTTGDCNVCAIFGKRKRYGAPYTASASYDKRYLVTQLWHLVRFRL